MLQVECNNQPLCDRLTRREWLRIGSVGIGGLSLPALLQAGPTTTTVAKRAKSVILFWLTGGVPQHDTWDPKPNGPAAARSAFGVIPCKTPGLFVGAMMPKTAKLTDRIAVIRSMHTGDNAHSSSGYQMLTGIPHSPLNRENALPGAPNDWPSLGALVRTQRRDRQGLPAAVTLPRHIANVGEKVWPGQDAGFLKRRFDPWLLTCDPSSPKFKIPDLTLPTEVSRLRLNRRLSLLQQVNRRLDYI